MINLIRNWFTSKTLELENKIQEQRIITKTITKIAAEAGISSRDDLDGFQRINNPQDREKGFTQGDQREMIRQARKMYRFDPHARGILQTMVNYIVGKGFDIKPKSQDPKINYIWWEFWNSPRSNMQMKRFEMILRFFRDGDCFLEFFSRNEKNVETGLSTVRFVDPLLVKNPTDGNSTPMVGGVEVIRNGVEIDPNDVEKVVAYYAEEKNNYGKFRKIDAVNMIHMKALADSDQRRGETFLQTIMPLIAHYNNWLENRIILNRMRSAIVLIKKVSGTSSELGELKGNMGNQNAQGKTVVKAGKVLIANEGVDYKMESPNINASDVSEDGRNIKLAMSAGTNLPEYIFGDASNANFSSTLIAESPFVKAIEYWQIIIELYIKQIYKKVIENAVKAGRIQAPSDDEYFKKIFNSSDLTEAEKEEIDDMLANGVEPPSEIFYGCDIQWPEIIHRDMKAHTDALMVARTNGWIADSTASSSLGYDYDEEVRKQQKIEQNAQEFPNPLLGKGMQDPMEADEDEMDDEEEDVKKDLENEDEDDDKEMANAGGDKNDSKA